MFDNQSLIASIKVHVLTSFAESNCYREAVPPDCRARIGMQLIWLSDRAAKPCRALLHRGNICTAERGRGGVDDATRRDAQGAMNLKDAAAID